MKKFLRKFDLNGNSCTFFMKNESKKTSWKSGLLFLIFLAGFSLYLVTEILDWTDLQYSTNSFIVNFNSKPIINFSMDPNFMIAFCNFNSQNSSLIDPFIEEGLNDTLQWRYISRLPWLFYGGVNIPLQQCTYDMFPKKSVNKYNNNNFESCKCANAISLMDYNISFAEKDSFSTYLSYDIKFKDYIYQNQSLYNFYYQYLKTNRMKIYTYFISTVVDTNDKSGDYLSSYLEFHSSYINSDLYSTNDIFLSKANIKISDSLLFSKKFTSNTGIQLYKAMNYFLIQNNSIANITNKFHTINFRSSNFDSYMSKSNLKFDDFLSKIFAFIGPWALLLIYLSNYVNESEKLNQNISKIFKGFEINQIMMKKIRIIMEDFNEVEYKENPNFNDDIIERKLETEPDNIINAKDFNQKNTEVNYCPKIEIIPNQLRVSNNDPINYKKYNQHLVTLNEKKETISDVKKFGFNLQFTDLLPKCCKSKNTKKREKFFLDALSLYNYTLDITTYFKKMTEIEIIKYFLFTENERDLISVLSNPDFSHQYEQMNIKLNNQYRKLKIENFEDRIEILLKKVIIDGRRNGNNKNNLLKLIQNGNQILFN